MSFDSRGSWIKVGEVFIRSFRPGAYALMYVRQIACFAYSRKSLGRCVAGKQIGNGAAPLWIRPVGGRPTEEIFS
jgi:hypothetical protein